MATHTNRLTRVDRMRWEMMLHEIRASRMGHEIRARELAEYEAMIERYVESGSADVLAALRNVVAKRGESGRESGRE